MESGEHHVEMHAIVHGRVQGVFFRATTQDYARQLQLKGTVKNLEDGTVEIVAQGPKNECLQLLEHLKRDAGMGSVSHIDVNFAGIKQIYDKFSVMR